MKRVLVVHMSYHTPAHRRTLRTVREVLKKKGIEYCFVHRARINPDHVRGCDLIIVIGGDGTFLRTSHFVEGKTPLLGVNSDPSKKEGFFLRTYAETFQKRLEKILAGKEKPTKLARVKAFIDNKRVEELALNEFFFGARKSYRMALYRIKVGNKEEQHKSSGVIVAAPAGSHAWALSAGGKRVPLTSGRTQYLVRELYRGKLTGHEIKHGFLK
ncbi:hypothetical protein D6764_00120, partial [Candidatus Woesearchaeota archaeon]